MAGVCRKGEANMNLSVYVQDATSPTVYVQDDRVFFQMRDFFICMKINEARALATSIENAIAQHNAAKMHALAGDEE